MNHMENQEVVRQLQEVCERFRIPGQVCDYRLITSGNINTT